MLNKNLSKITATLLFSICICLFAGCFEEQHPGTYYSFSGFSIASRLESRSDDFSEFIKILKRSGQWTELQTYGFHTCFAPYNAAIEEFLKERSEKDGVVYNSVDDLPKDLCDSLAYNHLVDITCYVGEMQEGAFPKVNLLDRYLMLSFDSLKNKVVGNDTIFALRRCINKFSHIVERDDTCENGVIHTIDKCIDFTGNYVYDLVDHNPATTIFAQALKYCGFYDILNEYYDDSYTIGLDSVGPTSRVYLTKGDSKYQLLYWEKRKKCFTIFIEPDEVLARYDIHSLEDLEQYAKKVYDEVYPDAKDVTDPTDPRNSLNRFLAYHILPCKLDYGSFNTRSDLMDFFNAGITDPEDYFSPLAPHSLMRISTEVKSRLSYINGLKKVEKGTTDYNGPVRQGIRILTPGEMGDVVQLAMNGIIHYIDDILVYDNEVRNVWLDRRLRIDCGTMSPDFINSGARGAYPYEGSGNRSIGFKDPENYIAINKDYRIQLRPVEKTTNTYEGDAVDIDGMFDMYVKLPAVPHDGTWQLRMSFRALSQCGIVQYYMTSTAPGGEVTNDMWKPLGLPIDLRVNLDDSAVGWIKDDELEDEEAIDALDKSMKNRGWMKGPDSQITQYERPHRDEDHQGRCIISTEFMYSNMDYYLRFKQILDKAGAQYCLDYLELVPKSVYDHYEDKH